MTPQTHTRNNLALAALLLVEYGLFRQFALREVVWSYPAGWDQVQYLTDAYNSYEKILRQGLGAGLRRAAALQAPQGFLVHLEAALLFLVLGPSRLSALTLNFLHFAALQWCLARTLRWLTGGWTVSLLALGLLLALASPFYTWGGLMDFRLDFGALCLYGIFLCAVVRSRLLAPRGGALLAGLAGGACALFRYVSLPYVLGTLFALLGVSWLRARRRTNQEGARASMRGALLTVAVVVAMVAPAFWIARNAIAGYYVEGHLRSQEKAIRAREQGAGVGLEALAFYPRSLARDHLGTPFGLMAGLALALAATGRVARSRLGDPGHAEAPPVETAPLAAALGASVLVPLAILTILPSKSGVVVSIVLPGVIWLLAVAFWRGACDGAGRRVQRAAACLAVAAFAFGLWQHTAALAKTSGPERRERAAEVIRLYDVIAAAALASGWDLVRVSDNAISETLYGRMLMPLAYERHGRVVTAQVFLGDYLLAVDGPQALQLLGYSDFVALTVAPPRDTPWFPFHDSMRALHTTIRDFCEARFERLGRFRLPEGDVLLYQRPSMRMEGESGGWITSAGLSLVGEGAVVGRHPILELRGPLNLEWLGGRVPRVQARLQAGDTESPLPASLISEDVKDGRQYVIRVEVDPRLVTAPTPVRIHLTFDAHFVPARLGMSDDLRELVIPYPRELRMSERAAKPR